jgi:hypothetical protein
MSNTYTLSLAAAMSAGPAWNLPVITTSSQLASLNRMSQAKRRKRAKWNQRGNP